MQNHNNHQPINRGYASAKNRLDAEGCARAHDHDHAGTPRRRYPAPLGNQWNRERRAPAWQDEESRPANYSPLHEQWGKSV